VVGQGVEKYKGVIRMG